jgi:biopolymer transport protein TolR
MRKRHRGQAVSDLNITNLVDVTFTLLIIFMIAAPMMTQGVQVDLPKTDSKNVEVNEYINVSVNKRGEIYIDQERIALLDFGKRFRQVFGGRAQVPVFVSGDKQVAYGLMLRVISDIQNAGVVKLGFLSQPLEEKAGAGGK